MIGLPSSELLPASADCRVRDGRVTLTEWTASLRLIRAGPLNVLGVGATATSTIHNDADLFAELDEDLNNAISLDHAKRRATDLKKLDIYEGESLSDVELRQFKSPQPSRGQWQNNKPTIWLHVARRRQRS